MGPTIVIVNSVDHTEVTFASVDDMPEGALKEEIKKVIKNNPRARIIRKILR